MGIIQLENINLRKLHKISSGYHLESDLYHNNVIIYKIFKNMIEQAMEIKQRKIELLHDGNSLPNVVMPKDELYFYTKFFGYTMDYIRESIPLFDFKLTDKNIGLFFQILTKISKSTETIHKDPREIIISDLNFDNIIIDKSNNPHFVDIDSCSIDGIPGETIPNILHNFYNEKKKNLIATTKETDKLSLLLCTLYLIFQEEIKYLSMYEYDKKTEQIQTLKDMRGLVLELKNNKSIPSVPYIHEIIASGDTLSKSRKRI